MAAVRFIYPFVYRPSNMLQETAEYPRIDPVDLEPGM